MDWLTSLSPDSSDNEQPPEPEKEFKKEINIESSDKTDEKNKLGFGGAQLQTKDSTLKFKENDPKNISYRSNNLLTKVDEVGVGDNDLDDPKYLSNLPATDRASKSSGFSQLSENEPPDNDILSTEVETVNVSTISNQDGTELDNTKKATHSLFSIADSTRKITTYNKITIKSQELSESDLKELTQPSRLSNTGLTFSVTKTPINQGLTRPITVAPTEPTQPAHINKPGEYVEKVDFNEALHSFNKSNLNMDKLTNQWIGSKLNIKEIKADDLLAGSEKERLTRTPMISDDRKRFSLPTKLMETDDGQVITTNVARRTQKRKHQINWLAMESQDKEIEIMERTAHMRKSKRETQMKYGW